MLGILSMLAECIWAIHTRVADSSLPSLAALAQTIARCFKEPFIAHRADPKAVFSSKNGALFVGANEDVISSDRQLPVLVFFSELQKLVLSEPAGAKFLVPRLAAALRAWMIGPVSSK